MSDVASSPPVPAEERHLEAHVGDASVQYQSRGNSVDAIVIVAIVISLMIGAVAVVAVVSIARNSTRKPPPPRTRSQ